MPALQTAVAVDGYQHGAIPTTDHLALRRLLVRGPSDGDLGLAPRSRLVRMPEESNASVTLRLKLDRRRVTRSGWRRHTDGLESLGGFQPHAALWMRIAATLTRLREATAIANAQRARSVLLRERARKLSVHLASTIALP